MNLFPPITPHRHGWLDVGEGHSIYWEECGNPEGKPAVAFHGGPGSGITYWFRRLFDPEIYRIILFDQRNCGRSLPPASDPATDLTSNTTWHLVADAERLREHLEIEKWLVLGGSWGSVLALAYAETHPDKVSEMVLFGVATGDHSELDWLFRGGLSRFFPKEWDALCEEIRALGGEGDVIEAMHRLLEDPDPDVRQSAAKAWCRWESATPAWPPTEGLAGRFHDPKFAYAFARLVIHYVRNNLWIDDGVLLRNARVLANIPAVLINGRFDFQSPIQNVWKLKEAWPTAELVIVNDAGHAASGALGKEIRRAINSMV